MCSSDLEADDEADVLLMVLGRDPRLRRIALFDHVVNNADRKGGHLLPVGPELVHGCDHGICFAVEPKLRTVLWGWAGDPLPASLLADVENLAQALRDGLDDVDRWLDEEEREALRDRCRDLLREQRFPLPSGHWPAIPWPVF